MTFQATDARDARNATIAAIRAGGHQADAIYQDISQQMDQLIQTSATLGKESINAPIEIDANAVANDLDSSLTTMAVATVVQDLFDAGYDIERFSFEAPNMLYIDMNWIA